jgi:hypothetical protein
MAIWQQYWQQIAKFNHAPHRETILLACQCGNRLLNTRSGRSPLWVKVKNPQAPAVKREAEEDWGREPAAANRVQAFASAAKHPNVLSR